MSEWQPIETAPRDKTKVLICQNGLGPIIAHQTGAGIWVHTFLNHDSPFKVIEAEHAPTHWMPLPLPPGTD